MYTMALGSGHSASSSARQPPVPYFSRPPPNPSGPELPPIPIREVGRPHAEIHFDDDGNPPGHHHHLPTPEARNPPILSANPSNRVASAGSRRELGDSAPWCGFPGLDEKGGGRRRRMRKAYRDSLKVLEADIQHANTLASEFPREYDGACLQMRLSYSPAAHIFLFLVQWTDCSLAGALGLLRILIYKVYVDGTTTMSTHERKASIKEFYAVLFPSLLQLQRGITDMEDKKQKAVCTERYRRRDEDDASSLSDIDVEREEECGICMEMNSKVVLPNCTHAMCLRCYQDWYSRSQSCPFCRDNLKKTQPGDLWIYIEDQDMVDMETVSRENLRRLFMYINKLPLIVPDVIFSVYDSHIK